MEARRHDGRGVAHVVVAEVVLVRGHGRQHLRERALSLHLRPQLAIVAPPLLPLPPAATTNAPDADANATTSVVAAAPSFPTLAFTCAFAAGTLAHTLATLTCTSSESATRVRR